MYVLSRMQAFKVAWTLFWFATGTPQVGVISHRDQLEFVGADYVRALKDRGAVMGDGEQ